MGTQNPIEEYDYLRRVDAVCDLIIAAVAAGAETPEELNQHLPGILENCSEYHAELVQRVQPGLLKALLKPKNGKAAAHFFLGLKQHIAQVSEGLAEGRPVVSTFQVATSELYWAMGLVPIYPETFTTINAGAFNDGVEAEVDEAEEEGVPGHICAFQKAPFRAMEKGFLPKPDVLTKATAPCDSSNIMYQRMAKKLNVPLVVVDSPYYNDRKAFRYFLEQFNRMIKELEKLTGHTLDEDLLRKQVKRSNEYLYYQYKLQKLRRHVPCPDPGTHRLLDAMAVFTCGENDHYLTYIKTCYEEAKERVEQGSSFLPEGKQEIRTLMSNAMVPNMLYMADWAEDEFGATFLECGLSSFPGDIVGFVDTDSLESMIEGLAWRSFNFPMSRNVMGHTDIHVNDMMDIARDYKADAAVFSGNHSCKYAWTLPKIMGDALQEELGIPSLNQEIDFLDARFTPHAAMKQQLSEFFKTLM